MCDYVLQSKCDTLCTYKTTYHKIHVSTNLSPDHSLLPRHEEIRHSVYCVTWSIKRHCWKDIKFVWLSHGIVVSRSYSVVYPPEPCRTWFALKLRQRIQVNICTQMYTWASILDTDREVTVRIELNSIFIFQANSANYWCLQINCNDSNEYTVHMQRILIHPWMSY